MELQETTERVGRSRTRISENSRPLRSSVEFSDAPPYPHVTVRRLRSLWQGLSKVYVGAALILLNTIVLWACFEIGASSIGRISRSFTAQPDPLVGDGYLRETVSYYASQPWAKKYWHEFKLTRKVRYFPYVGWRRAPFTGETIHIDKNGLRLTPGAACGAGSYKVFTFGASTMWGTGSPDWLTIPAQLQAGLATFKHQPVCVMNFGEFGFVSTQGVVELLNQLQSGNVPDLVISYDGPNDVYASYQSGRVGAPQDLDQLTAKFENTPKLETLAADHVRNYSSLYSLIDSLMAKMTVRPPQEPTTVATYETMGIGADRLGPAVARRYFANYATVNALAEQYGFRYMFFFQPIVSLGNKPLTDEELKMKNRWYGNDPAVSALCTTTYQAATESPERPHFHDLTHLFDGYAGLLWIDEYHVTPVGNELIAKAMIDHIKNGSF